MNSFRNVTLSIGSFELMLKTEICKEDKIDEVGKQAIILTSTYKMPTFFYLNAHTCIDCLHLIQVALSSFFTLSHFCIAGITPCACSSVLPQTPELMMPARKLMARLFLLPNYSPFDSTIRRDFLQFHCISFV